MARTSVVWVNGNPYPAEIDQHAADLAAQGKTDDIPIRTLNEAGNLMTVVRTWDTLETAQGWIAYLEGLGLEHPPVSTEVLPT